MDYSLGDIYSVMNEILHHTYSENYDIITDNVNFHLQSFQNKIKIPIYDEINLQPKLLDKGSRNERENVPFLRKEKKNEYRLYLREDIFFNPQLFNSILIYDLLYHLYRDFITDKDASDIAFGILWEFTDFEYRDKIHQIWNEVHPIEILGNFTLHLASHVKRIHQKSHKNYAETMLERLVKLQNGVTKTEETSYAFKFGIFRLAIEDLTEEELNVLTLVISKNSTLLKDLQNELPNMHNIPKTIDFLNNSFVLRQRIEFSPTKLGLLNIIGIFHVPRGIGHHFKKIGFPAPKTRLIFRGTEDTVYLNFFIPDTRYAKKMLNYWLDNMIKPLFDNDMELKSGIFLPTHTIPRIGIEIEKYRCSFQRPELYSDGKWQFGEQIEIPFEKEISKNIPMTQLHLEVAKEMVKKPFTKTSIAEKVMGNRNTIFKIINILLQDEVITIRQVISFSHSFHNILLIYKVDESARIDFLQQLCTRVPLSVNYFFNDLLDENALIGVSFIGIPDIFLQTVITIANNIVDDVQIAFLPETLENTPDLNLDTIKTGWKFMNLPELYLTKYRLSKRN